MKMGPSEPLSPPCMGARDERKVTPGITELSRLRVRIDGAACYIDVGSTYPGSAEVAKNKVL